MTEQELISAVSAVIEEKTELRGFKARSLASEIINLVTADVKDRLLEAYNDGAVDAERYSHA